VPGKPESRRGFDGDEGDIPMSTARDFGATGDGVTDDTAALRHALADGDGRLDLDPGTYRITGTLEVALDHAGPLAIQAAGGTARIVMAAPGPALRVVGTHRKSAAPEGFNPKVWLRERMPTLDGFEIVGEHPEAIGVELDGTMQATLTRLLIRRCHVGARLTGRNRNVLISACHIYDGAGPGAIGVHFVDVDLHQTIIAASHISYHKKAGIRIERSEVRNLQITGCDIEYNHDVEAEGSADIWIDAREGRVRELTIASNTIQAKGSPGGSNIRILGPDGDDAAGAGLCAITGNILQDQMRNVWLTSCRGVTIVGNSFAAAYDRSLVIEKCRHITVGSCTFDHNPDYDGGRVDGIRIDRCRGVSLSGLMLEDCRAGDAEHGAAIEVRRSETVRVDGCQVIDPHWRGIEVTGSNVVAVANCTVADHFEPQRMIEGIRVADIAPGDLIRVSGCAVDRGRKGGIAIDDPESCELDGNFLMGVRP
jgi:polygalacturonase